MTVSKRLHIPVAEAEEYFGMNVFSFAHPDEDDVDDNFLIGL